MKMEKTCLQNKYLHKIQKDAGMIFHYQTQHMVNENITAGNRNYGVQHSGIRRACRLQGGIITAGYFMLPLNLTAGTGSGQLKLSASTNYTNVSIERYRYIHSEDECF